MKQIIYTVLFLVAIGLTGCQKAEYLLFNDIARVQMDEANEILTSFYYMDAAIGRDTVYLTVNTIGDPENRVRQIALEQISEYDVEYKYDEKGNLIDSILTEKPNKAVAGVHYVPMDDPEMLPLLVIQPNAVTAEIPVILLRDASLKEDDYRLCLRLKATDDFRLGETGKLSGTIVLSDKLSKPNFWNSSVDRYYFGVYSTRKHEFMIEVMQTEISDAWWNKLSADYAEINYTKDKLRDALQAYNDDPDNKVQGLAPMRENQNDPNSALITVPS